MDLARLEALRRAGASPWPPRSRRTHLIAQLEQGPPSPSGPMCGLPVRGAPAPDPWVAGRILTLAPGELTLADPSGALTLRIEASPMLGQLAPGDLVEARVEREEGGWRGAELVLLAPALTQAPIGLPGRDPFGHQRPGGGASLTTVRERARLLHALRTWFMGRGFVEVETPSLATTPGMEPHLDPFETRFRTRPGDAGRPAWLLTSPEYAMKTLVVHGLERCFQLSRVFRNGEAGPFHNPEFTLLEWYRAHASYLELLEDCQELILHLAVSMGRGLSLTHAGISVDLSPPWERLTVREAVQRYAGLDLATLTTAEALGEAARGVGVKVPPGAAWDEVFFLLLMERVEPHLGHGRPTFLMDYPAALAALARVREGEFPVAERFELYIAGVEVGNAFSELTDPVLQIARFEEERAHRAQIGAPVFEWDRDYIEALAAGLPPTGGIAVGIDRLVMLLLGAGDVRSTLAFPWRG